MNTRQYLLTGALLTCFLGTSALASVNVRVTVTNNGPANGVAITPLWVGFHDGSFDSYNGGLTSQQGLEALAEDGNNAVISADFQGGYTYIDNSSGSAVSARVLSSQPGSQRVDGSIGSETGPPPIQAGQSASRSFSIATDGSNRYFSYAGMVLPTNDFFLANGNPLGIDLMSLYDGEGSVSFNIGGFNASPVNDAGTEAESYVTSAANGLFGLAGGQAGPDSPAGSLGLPITNVVGSLPLDALNFIEGSQPQFDFNNGDLYPNGIATVTITAGDANAVPEPTTIAVWGILGLLGTVYGYRNKQQRQAA